MNANVIARVNPTPAGPQPSARAHLRVAMSELRAGRCPVFPAMSASALVL